MTTIIHFVRHGAYENPDGIVPGRIPGFHLSKEGKQKAKKVGKFFKGRPIKIIYTSPLERAFETANLISDYLPEAKIAHVYDLIEIDAIHWQAYKYEELYTNNYYEEFLNNPQSKNVPENIQSLASRMEKFVYNLIEKHPGEEVICVSHDYPIVALRLALEKKPLELLKNYHASMGSITTFIFQGNELKETRYTEL